MNLTTLRELIDGMEIYIPVRKIELSIGMPITTLQKSLKGVINLPKRWEKPLLNFVKNVASDNVVEKINQLKQKPIQPKGIFIDLSKIITPVQEDIKLIPDEIQKQIDAINSEVIPPERSTTFGKKVWKLDQLKRINELKSKAC